MLFRRPNNRHCTLTLGRLITGFRSRGSIGSPRRMLRQALRVVAMTVGMAVVSGCALQTMVQLGQADAEYRLGLQELVADPPDYEKALVHFREAAIQDHREAQRQLGRMYASLSPQPDLIRGFLWLFLAARSDAEAKNELEYLAGLMTPQQIDAARALAAGFVPGSAPDEPPEALPKADSTEAPVEEQTAKPESDDAKQGEPGGG